MKPAETDDERLAIECLRYQSHIQTVSDLGTQVIEMQRKMNSLQGEKIRVDHQFAMFVAEAMDSAATLEKMGVTQEDRDKLASIQNSEVSKLVENSTNITNILTVIGRKQ